MLNETFPVIFKPWKLSFCAKFDTFCVIRRLKSIFALCNEIPIFLSNMNIDFGKKKGERKSFWQMRVSLKCPSPLLRIYLIRLISKWERKSCFCFRWCSTLTRFLCATPYGKAAGRWQAPSSRITSTVLQSEQGSTTSKHNKATWHLRFDASTEPLVVEQQHLDHFHRHVVLKEIKA